MKVQETNPGVEKLQTVLEMLRVAIRGKDSRKELPLQMIYTLMYVMQNDGIPMGDAAKDMNVQPSTVSRNVKDMDVYLEEDENGKKVQKGCGLLYRAPNEHNRREFSIFLTPKGVKMKKEIEKILN